eukprot:m.1608010 g.1608010  ORF g.1608010 m.1608010 type:complete len:621 (+) comp25363_c0_seq9:144-2006(+)
MGTDTELPSRLKLFLPLTSREPNEHDVFPDVSGPARDFAYQGETLLIYLVVTPPPEASVIESAAHKAFVKRFHQLDLTSSISIASDVHVDETTYSPYESSRFPSSAVVSVGYADLCRPPFVGTRFQTLPSGEIVFEKQIQLSQISAVTQQATIIMSCQLVTDPLLSDAEWQRHMQDMTAARADGSPSGHPLPALYFSGDASITLEIRKPPHVFCATTEARGRRYVSVDVHNHQESTVTIKNLHLYLNPAPTMVAPKNTSRAEIPQDSEVVPSPADRKGSASVPTSRTSSPRGSPLLSNNRKQHKRHPGVSHTPTSSPLAAKSGSSISFSPGLSDATSSNALQSENKQQSLRMACLPRVSTLHATLPEELAPHSTSTFVFQIRPPAAEAPTDATTADRFDPVRACVAVTWSVDPCFVPVTCKYELFSVQPRPVQLSLAVSRTSTSIKTGDTFTATFTLMNNSSARFSDLFMLVAHPELTDRQAPPKSRPSADSLQDRRRTFAAARTTRLRQSLSAIGTLDAGAHRHVHALDNDPSAPPGLVCRQKLVHLGTCEPSSAVSSTLTFVAYAVRCCVPRLSICDGAIQALVLDTTRSRCGTEPTDVSRFAVTTYAASCRTGFTEE